MTRGCPLRSPLVKRATERARVEPTSPGTEHVWVALVRDEGGLGGQISTKPLTHQWGRSADGRFRLRLDFPASEGGPAIVRVTAEDERLPGWTIEMRLAPTDDGFEPVEIRHFANGENHERMGSRLARRFGLGQVEEEISLWLQDRELNPYLAEPWRRKPKRPGRAGRDDLDYAMWARKYVAAVEREPRRALQSLIDAENAELPAHEHLTDSQVRAFLNRARNRGLLTEAPAGRSGGELTNKAKKMLAAYDEASERANAARQRQAKNPKSGR